MDEPIVNGNCGELCGYHCCRSHEADENLGMYLIPYEYEVVQSRLDIEYEVHSSYTYDLPRPLKRQYYVFCHNNSGCLRKMRPLQCRTYPLEPHLNGDILQLVIEKDQLHACPLIDQQQIWRPEFVKGVYEAWQLLLEEDKIKTYIISLSETRIESDNILVVVR